MTIKEKLEEMGYEILPPILDTGEYLILHFTKTYKHIAYCNIGILVDYNDVLDIKPSNWVMGLTGEKGYAPRKFADACVELKKEEDDFLEWCKQEGKITEKTPKTEDILKFKAGKENK